MANVDAALPTPSRPSVTTEKLAANPASPLWLGLLSLGPDERGSKLPQIPGKMGPVPSSWEMTRPGCSCWGSEAVELRGEAKMLCRKLGDPRHLVGELGDHTEAKPFRSLLRICGGRKSTSELT